MKPTTTIYQVERVMGKIHLTGFDMNSTVSWPVEPANTPITQYEFGRPGRGAKALALAILVDFLESTEAALIFYLAFCGEHVQKWQGRIAIMRGDEVLQFLKQQGIDYYFKTEGQL